MREVDHLDRVAFDFPGHVDRPLARRLDVST